jgi:hypothetical protein
MDLPEDVLERLRQTLTGADPAKASRALEIVTGGNFRCKTVLEETLARFVCLAERVYPPGYPSARKFDGLTVRVEMDYDLAAGELKRITLERLPDAGAPEPG